MGSLSHHVCFLLTTQSKTKTIWLRTQKSKGIEVLHLQQHVFFLWDGEWVKRLSVNDLLSMSKSLLLEFYAMGFSTAPRTAGPSFAQGHVHGTCVHTNRD